ncbi:MAG: glycosyltransferase family protein, partial [Bacteriovorax sp.]|nr:glycosyltransferase family protein [Bacteriovorax sp.]
MKKIVTIEARMTSTRLPGKVLMPLLGKPVLERMVERIKRAKKIDGIVVATTINDADDLIVDLCNRLNVSVFRGSEYDVLGRVLGAAEALAADIIIELTGDCPLIDPSHIDEMIDYYLEGQYDYASNRLELGLPDGFDVQVFSCENLKKISHLTNDPIDRVHVSCFFYNNPQLFKIGKKKISVNDLSYFPELAVTLDEQEDYE